MATRKTSGRSVPRRGKIPQITKSLLSEEQILEEIRRVAYGLYEKRGCVPGDDLADWYEAEKQVKRNRGVV